MSRRLAQQMRVRCADLVKMQADLGMGLPIWGWDCRSGDVASVDRQEHDQKFYWNHDILAKGIDD